MRIVVKLFAILADRAGTRELILEMPAQSQVEDAISELSKRHPIIREMLARAAPALNRVYAATSTTLHDGDELALIPPVSGG